MKRPARLRDCLRFDLYQYILFHAESKSPKLSGVSFFPPLQTGLAQCGNFVFIFLRHIPASLCPLDFQIAFIIGKQKVKKLLWGTADHAAAIAGYAKRVPSRISAGILQSTASLREITSSFAGDKLYSAPAAWADNARVGKAGRSSKKTESPHLAEMGRAYEHLEGAGGEKNFE